MTVKAIVKAINEADTNAGLRDSLAAGGATSAHVARALRHHKKRGAAHEVIFLRDAWTPGWSSMDRILR